MWLRYVCSWGSARALTTPKSPFFCFALAWQASANLAAYKAADVRLREFTLYTCAKDKSYELVVKVGCNEQMRATRLHHPAICRRRRGRVMMLCLTFAPRPLRPGGPALSIFKLPLVDRMLDQILDRLYESSRAKIRPTRPRA